MTELIQQREDMDCGVCVLAMASGLPYEQVREALSEVWSPADGLRQLHKALACVGLLKRVTLLPGRATTYEGDAQVRYRAFEVSPAFFRDFAWGRRAIMCVPSLNRPGELHMIYTDNEAIFDPSQKRRYERWDDLAPEELVLFRERHP